MIQRFGDKIIVALESCCWHKVVWSQPTTNFSEMGGLVGGNVSRSSWILNEVVPKCRIVGVRF